MSMRIMEMGRNKMYLSKFDSKFNHLIGARILQPTIIDQDRSH